MKTRWAPVLGVYASILLAWLLVIGGFFVSALVVGLDTGPRGLLIGVLVTTWVLSATTALLTARDRFFTIAPRRLGLDRFDPLDVTIATCGVLGTSFFLDGLIGLLGLHDVGTLANIRDTLGPLTGLEKLGAALVIGFGPGIGEELFFRGYVLRRLIRPAGTIHALVVSSVAFGLFHLDLVQGPAAIGLGFYLGVAVLLSGSLWTGILAHAANNAAATALAMVELDDSRAVVLMLAGLLASVSGILLLAQRRRTLRR